VAYNLRNRNLGIQQAHIEIDQNMAQQEFNTINRQQLLDTLQLTWLVEVMYNKDVNYFMFYLNSLYIICQGFIFDTLTEFLNTQVCLFVDNLYEHSDV
jgi:hypothetical protein